MAQYHGIRNVTASSSASDIEAIPSQWASGLLPYSAVDGDLRTMWESGSWTGPVGQWIQLDFDSPVDPGKIHVAFADSAALGPPVAQVGVSTAAGQVTDPVAAHRRRAAAAGARTGASGWLRITVTGLASQPHPAGRHPGGHLGDLGAGGPGQPDDRRPCGCRAGDPSAVVLAKAAAAAVRLHAHLAAAGSAHPTLATPTEEQYGFDHAFTEPAADGPRCRGSAVLTTRRWPTSTRGSAAARRG